MKAVDCLLKAAKHLDFVNEDIIVFSWDIRILNIVAELMASIWFFIFIQIEIDVNDTKFASLSFT